MQLVGPGIQDYRLVAGAVAENRSGVRLVIYIQNCNLELGSVEAAGLVEQHKLLGLVVHVAVDLAVHIFLLAVPVEVDRILLGLGVQDILGG